MSNWNRSSDSLVRCPRGFAVVALLALPILFAAFGAGPARAQNAIVLENQQTGNPASEWDIDGAGDLGIQGFATDISVNRGDTVHFKIMTDAAAYHIDIYRLGYYQGNGARHVGTGVVTATLPQTQPADLTDPTTGITDCGNWSESAHWDVPGGAVSGLYIAKLTRDDTQGASHVVFIVRDDASHSDLLFQTSDATWQAYNVYGGNSLYVGGATGPPALNHASKVSYNRPYITRNGGGGGGASEDWLFNSEYPMIRWLEANGYDMTYSTDVDTDRRGNLITQHKVFMSVGHDEYWSGGARANVQAARDAGVHLAFFGGNEIYWKTRYEPSTDGASTPYRTLVCYKEGTLGENVCGGKCDPLPGVWTGLWRDGCPPTYAPNDGCLPENALSGNISWDGTQGALQVPDTYKNLRFWRNTPVAALGTGQTATLGANTLGYEWDWQQFQASYPPRRILLSSTNLDGKTHHLSLYRADSGALVFGAGTVQWSWGLDSHHDRGSDPPDASIQQATVNLFADMSVQPGSLQGGLVNASASSDALPPSSVIGFPPDGASLPSGTPVTITGTATDAGGGVVAGIEVSVDGGVTWSAANGAASWSFAWTPTTQGTVTIESRGYDDTGNLEVPGGGEAPPNVAVVTVTAPAPPTCPCTVFQPTDTPAVVSENDPTQGELGMKFRSSVDGFVTGVRFYKGSQNTSPHLGHLWTSTGTMLAEVTFAGETATGWQEATFDNPVAITAGTTYVVSYHGPGFYSVTSPYFTTGVSNGPLRGLAEGEDGSNGVYVYGATAFPNQTFNMSNYWVDVVFNTSVGPDVTPPTVTALSPGNGATGVATTTAVTATFSEPIDPATVSGSTVQLFDASNALVAATVSYNAPTRTVTLAPASALAYSTTYTAIVKGGGADPRIKDVAGNALAADVTWSFTTGATPPPPPTEGPGGPILVVSAAANPFSRYFAEVLRNEGLNEFSAMDVSLVTPAVLAQYDVVVLGEQPLSAGQVTMFTDWTTAGGTLVAMRPDKQLAGLMGLTDANATLSDRYLLVNTASGPGVGIVGQTIQYHGPADLYTLNGATSLATLYSNATTATANPAVTTRSVGGNGGTAVAFTYDLARSIVYTRQGNPAWANQKRDGQIPPIRSDDQFFGNASFDPQTDWIDLSKVAIPQADEQQRLLANVILKDNLHKKPLPRFWYLPKGLKAAIVMTGDNHGDAGMQPRFDIYRSESTSGCSVDDWECVRATGYEYVGSTFTDAQALFYHNMGFEVAVHVNTNCANFTQAEYQNFITSQFAQFHATFPSIPLPRTNRNHCIAWSDWSMTAETEVANGIRLDTNYYYWPDVWIQNRPGMFGGSGMPMRFAKLDGTMVDCYQAVTEMPDESGESFPQFSDALLDKAVGPEGYYGVFTTNMHFDQANHAGSNAVVASAQAHNIPVVSAEQMLTWLDGRNGSAFGGLTWSGNALSFTVTTGTGSRNLQGMLPTLAAVGALTGLTRGGSPVAYTTSTIKGIEYAFFPAADGNYVAQYAVDTVPPAISAVTAVPHTDGTATVSWTTNEAADSRVDYGTSAGALSLNASSAALATSHALTLSSLTPNTTYYYYRVTSADAASNAATEPNPPAAPLSFTTPASLCATDQAAADFAAGAPDANTAIASVADGEVILKPAYEAEFAGVALPGDMPSATWTAGGTTTVSGGALSLNGAHASTTPTFGPGSSLEFVATFQADPFQNIGFAADAAFDAPWITIGSGSGGNGVFARANPSTEVSLGGGLLGSSHRYRIDWTANSFVFYVDGSSTPAATLPVTVASPMVAILSDFNLNGSALTCDWLRVSPYATPGHFTSRVFDGGGPTNWGLAAWTAELPAGTSLAVNFRSGDTATPDGTWGAFTPVTNGASVGASGRYLQYRADLATTVPGVTPALDDLAVTCSAGADQTPPVITNVSAASATDGTSATVTWTTNEPATSRVDYGTSVGALTANSTSATLVASHSAVLTGLAPGTTYYYRVTSADAANNSATDPASPAAPRSFITTSPPCVVDATSADFGAGTPGAGTYVSATANGEVILAPTEGAEFGGAALPASWTSGTYVAGGTVTVAGGTLAVDGAYAATSALHGPGGQVEFVATFDAAAAKQHVGFGNTLNETPWAIFSTGSAGGTLLARTNDGTTTDDFTVPGSFLGAAHRFRIAWNATTVDFYVDGALVHTSTVTIAGPMRPIVSDGQLDTKSPLVDWMRLTPYASSGTFTSRVFDAGASSAWGAATWTSTVPAGTSLALSARLGNTSVPDASWTAYLPLAGSGSAVPGTSRYLQYRADLATTVATSTPELADLAIQCAPATDTSPPVIISVVATPAGDGQSASVTWSTDEPAASRVDYGTSAGSLTLSATASGLTLAHAVTLPGLSQGTVYYYRVTSADLAANSSTDPTPPAAPRTFTTSAPACFVDAVAADFAAGTTGASSYVTTTSDGEVTLAPTVGAEFGGAALPAGWVTLQWNPPNGTATVAGGAVTVDGTRINPSPTTYGPGTVLEFVATFAVSAPFQHIGFGGGTDANAGGIFNSSPWAMFSTGTSGAAIQARTWDGVTQIDHTLAGSFLGASHRYRIEWLTGVVNYYIDGTLVDAVTTTIAGPMRPGINDFTFGGPVLTVDWLRTTPYATSGSFLSRVFTSGALSAWGQATWSATTPAGTGLAILTREGNTPTPDGTWTAFTALAGSGSTVGGQSHYIQYRADLSTGDATVTPALADLTVQCVTVPDTTPPVISSVAAATGAGGTTATVTWTTDELSTSRMDYGTSAGALTQNVASATPVTAHSLGLSGLAPLTTYYYRVTSADAANNSATSPNAPAAPLSFTTPGPSCPADQALADFSAGTFDANTTTSLVADGEVILKPAFVTEFPGTTLPAGLQSSNTSPWTGGTATVAGSQLTVNGAHVTSTSSFAPGSSIEFVATFRADGFENIGFSGDAAFNNPWLTVGVPSAADGVYARASSGAQVLLSAAYLGTSHRYRIDWGATSFSIYVDQATTPAATVALTVGTSMVAQVSDLNLNANALVLDWLRVTPYASAGSFTSRVFDGAGATSWGVASWTADVPTGTSLAVNFRAGNSAVPDGTWSGFTAVTSGSSVNENSRYLQYRVDLATTAAGLTPALNDLAVACTPGADATPPVITNVIATPAGDGQSATVTWTTNESADSRVDYGTSPAVLGANVSAAPRVRSHSVLLPGLSPGTTYYYRVTSADASANAATSPNPPASPLSFATAAPTCFTEQSTADFAAGTPTSTYVSTTGDGEVILSPTSGTEFAGSTLPVGWQSATWAGGGTAVVSGGQLALTGAHAATTASFGPGRTLEFTATFRAKANQHAGFVADFSFNSPWAIFSTSGTTTTLSARVVGSSTSNVVLTTTLGVPHRFRIDWNATNFVFWVDGVQVTTITSTVSTNMLFHASDLTVGGLALSLDWVHISPYAAAGSFVSAVHDGGGPTNWANASWTASLPAGTSVALSVRAGNTAAPDGTWSAYQGVGSSGGSVGLCGRYVQYKADLATTVATSTPVLDAVSLACAPSSGPNVAVANLATAAGTGNDTSGRLKIALSWSGGTAGTTNVVYRKAFGDYPLYRGTVGAVPAAPASPTAAAAAGWALTGVTASGQTDQPPTRDYWYYVLFQKDACGASSPVSNRAAMPGYLLGDVSNGVTLCQGNNVVNAGDLSFLGAHYGATLSGPADPLVCLDVGPTTDFSTHGRPQPDAALDFEDLIVMALNYTGGTLPAMVTNPIGLTAASATTVPAPASANALTVAVPDLPAVGRTFDVVLTAASTGNAHGLSVDLGFDPAIVEQVSVAPGALLAEQASPSFALSPHAGRVDVALLGADAALAGSGELARVTFRVRAAGDPHFAIRGVDARDGANQKVLFGAATGDVAESLPARTELGAIYPNPFRNSLSLELKLAQPARVRLAVYDVAGRLVRSLLDGDQPAGRRVVLWDGAARTGVHAASGYYIVRFQAGSVVQTRPVWLVH